MRLIHIAGPLPPNLSGVGDYAVILGRCVAEQTEGGVQSAYVQAGYKKSDAPIDALESVDVAGRQSAEALVGAVDALAGDAERVAVLLHYVGYGYHRRGCPVWLWRAWRRLRARRSSVTLITMFHEVVASSRKPWTSVFWLAPVQRALAARIARLSDGIMTNRAASAEKLRTWAGETTPVRVSPTFSNVGEPDALPPYEEREPYAVVFGGAGRKAAMYERHGPALGDALRHMGVERVVDIGTPVPSDAADALALPAEAKGVLPAKEISAHLRQAAVGVLRYPLHCLTKSGLWAAYAAHGVPTVVLAERQQPAGKLESGRHFALLDALAGESVMADRRAAMSQAVKRWYEERGHSQRAAMVLEELLPSDVLTTAQLW